ncbi:MAG: tetratricopeptide repeat protein, partial [candidate division WOR-3 bacterium]
SVIVLISFIMSGPLLISISGLKNISETNIYILERLIVTSIISLIFLIIFTFSLLYNRKALLYLLIILNTFLFGKNLKDVSLRKNYFLYDYITNIFRNTPPNSILLSDRADETEFGLAYFQRCLKKHPDIEFIDCNASVSRSIYGNNYYKIWGETRLKIRNEVELKILSTSNKKIFYNTVLPQQTLTPKYKFGLLYKTSKDFNVEIPIEIFVIRNTDNLNIREFVLYNTYLNLLSNYYFDRSVELYDRKIWEVAKKLYIYLFLLNREYRYLTYIPYYYILKNELDNAEKEYLNIINKHELSDELKAEIFTNLAVVYERQNKIPLAIEYLLKVISLNPNYFQAYYNLASLYWRIGDFKKSLEIFEKLLYFKPNDEEVKRYIKYLKNKI